MHTETDSEYQARLDTDYIYQNRHKLAGLDQKFKADGGKASPCLLEKDMVHALAAVQATLDYGAQKYEARSWKNVDMERYDNAARRHRIARDAGEVRDPESGLYHRAHEIICLLFQLEMELERNLEPGLPPFDYTTFNKPPQDHKNEVDQILHSDSISRYALARLFDESAAAR